MVCANRPQVMARLSLTIRVQRFGSKGKSALRQ